MPETQCTRVSWILRVNRVVWHLCSLIVRVLSFDFDALDSNRAVCPGNRNSSASNRRINIINVRKTLGRNAYRLAVLLAGLVAVSACASSSSTYDNTVAPLNADSGLNTAYHALRAPVPDRVSPPGHKDAADSDHTARKPGKKIYLGKASYICSPSGFGQKSTCVLRSEKTWVLTKTYWATDSIKGNSFEIYLKYKYLFWFLL